jgi:hypothetical protein
VRFARLGLAVVDEQHPLRRAPARRPQEEGLRRGRAGHDRDSHPADARPHGVRRPRRVRGRREAAGPHSHPDRAPPGADRGGWPTCSGREIERAGRATWSTPWSRSRRSSRT